jgi:acyl carrier protein
MADTLNHSFSELQVLIGESLGVNPQSISPETRLFDLGDSLEISALLLDFEQWSDVDFEIFDNPRALRVQDLMDIAGIP